eukprot:TRINITY_DN4438_c0_g1_i1.p1 TRINITY_DN4438_c0_g1~~TRINITY_DN4438_c0_g1_i1.p1  ORF type:complete len:599 (+),score=99.85 TRINITY_DN4438_c0_g1_i1:27-1823(+)
MKSRDSNEISPIIHVDQNKHRSHNPNTVRMLNLRSFRQDEKDKNLHTFCPDCSAMRPLKVRIGCVDCAKYSDDGNDENVFFDPDTWGDVLALRANCLVKQMFDDLGPRLSKRQFMNRGLSYSFKLNKDSSNDDAFENYEAKYTLTQDHPHDTFLIKFCCCECRHVVSVFDPLQEDVEIALHSTVRRYLIDCCMDIEVACVIDKSSHQNLSELCFEEKERIVRNCFEELLDQENEWCIKVERGNELETIKKFPMLLQFSKAHQKRLHKRIVIDYDDEYGVDMGGLKREFFVEASKQLLDPKRGIFSLSERQNSYHFDIALIYDVLFTDKEEALDTCMAAGMMLGKAMLDGIHIPLYLSRTLWKVLIGEPIVCADLEQSCPKQFQALIRLLDCDVDLVYEGATFAYEFHHTQLNETRIVNLLGEGSENVILDDNNKYNYIKKRFQWRMFGSIIDFIKRFRDGFYKIIPQQYISFLTYYELEILACGVDINFEEWKQSTKIRGFPRDSVVIQWFWEIVENMEDIEKVKLFEFVTASVRFPPTGCASLNPQFTIMGTNTLDMIPIASTCFNKINISKNYTNQDTLRNFIYMAINQEKGFQFA